MEKNLSPLPEKAGTFLERIEKKLCKQSRNLSMGGTKHHMHYHGKRNHQPKMEEEGKQEPHKQNIEGSREDLMAITEEIDQFLYATHDNVSRDPTGVPTSAINGLATFLEKEVLRLETGHRSERPLIEPIDRVSKLINALGKLPTCIALVKRMTKVLQRVMVLLEEEFRSLLEDQRYANDAHNYPPVCVERLQRITTIMIPAGYETKCCQVFSIVRRDALIVGLAAIGFHGITTEEVQTMEWEELEGKISKWITALRQLVTIYFPCERQLCELVFSEHPAVSTRIFNNLARGTIVELLSFIEHVASMKPSIEKLYKFLDMYEATRGLMPEIDNLFLWENEDGPLPSPLHAEIKSEMSTAMSRMKDAILGIFRDLETSIRNYTGKNPIPGGTIHPLTRYVMNYLKYACEYGPTLEQIFQACHCRNNKDKNEGDTSPFANELMVIMDLLDEKLNCKSKMYKDQSLSYIFLMNNGRYIVQNLKGWPDIKKMLGDVRCRKRSTDLRQYHKNYQRETWGKVLGCLKDEGLQGKGSGNGIAVPKAFTKEIKRQFKSFNSMFEDIHKTQRNWVVSDEQLRSELRVSVSAVVVPAYRSFLGKYRQYLGGGKSDHKYVKFGPEDVEKRIEELFDGNPSSMARKRN